ncbi:MAG: hypothetical protein Q9221_008677 [Calogaya cf. arnoldii]
MEALAVLGLVANIVQLLDAAGNAFTVCCEIYTLGRSIEDTSLAFTSEQLHEAYGHLSKSLNNTAIPIGSGINLMSLATQCCETAKTLQEELDALRKPPGSGVRATIKKAWLKKQKTKAIKKLKFALSEYEKALDTKILIDVRQTLGTLDAKQEGQSKQLGQQLSQLSSDLKACQLGFAGQLSSEIDRYVTASEAQHEVTRDHVKTHITDLNRSHIEQLSEQRRQQHGQQQHDQFLHSLRFREIHTRMNDIADSHSQTLHWMFEDDATRPWDSFCSWLQADDRLYWINGKPGSGKSTLMKFLINDPRTRDLLAKGSSSKSPLIVGFYFWLSGSEMQRSFKGFLCSIIHQLVHEDRRLVTKLLRRNTGLLSKRNTGDWSKQELQRILTEIINLLDRPLCIFLDGLDEFDQKDDIDLLLNLVEAGFELALIKFCISSRPENYITKRLSGYKQLHLQDLTAYDIESCILTKLKATRNQCPPTSIDDEYLERIVKTIAKKADGVFLWVYYALNCLVRGTRNEDDFGVLLGRIEELPNGMHQLYLQMWNRLKEDQQHYQEEAATYFSYVATCFAVNEHFPLSLFEMLAALDPQLQSIILDDLNPQDPFDLAQKREQLKSRIITRSAGLLEFSMEEETDTDEDEAGTDGDETDRDDCSLLSENSQPMVAMDDYETLTHSPSNQSRESLCDPASQSDADFFSPKSPQNDIPYRAGTHSNHMLAVQHRTKLKYLHRTARDFLLSTEDGRRVCGKPKDSLITRSINIVRARMTALVQGLLKFDSTSVENLILDIKRYFCEGNPNEKHETESLIFLRRLCQSLSVPGDPQHHIGYTTFWMSSNPGFEGNAAECGCTEYVQKFVQDRASYIDPRRRGLLVLHALTNPDLVTEFPGVMALVSWLATNGAELHMTYLRGIHISTPASEILLQINRFVDSKDEMVLRRSYDSLHALLPYLGARSGRCILKLSLGSNGFVGSAGSPWDSDFWEVSKGQILVHMSILKFCYLVMERVEDRLPYVTQWRKAADESQSLGVVASANLVELHGLDYADCSSRPDIGEVSLTRIPLIGIAPERDNVLRWSELNSDAPCVCPSENDALYLGKALERILFSSSVPASSVRAFFEDLNARLDEVGERSEYKELGVWKREYTKAVDEDGELARDCDLDLESLGDKWYV